MICAPLLKNSTRHMEDMEADTEPDPDMEADMVDMLEDMEQA